MLTTSSCCPVLRLMVGKSKIKGATSGEGFLVAYVLFKSHGRRKEESENENKGKKKEGGTLVHPFVRNPLL